MKIRIYRGGFEAYGVKRQNDNGLWSHWLPKEGWFKNPSAALISAREEHDSEIALKCLNIGYDEHFEVEI